MTAGEKEGKAGKGKAPKALAVLASLRDRLSGFDPRAVLARLAKLRPSLPLVKGPMAMVLAVSALGIVAVAIVVLVAVNLPVDTAPTPKPLALPRALLESIPLPPLLETGLEPALGPEPGRRYAIDEAFSLIREAGKADLEGARERNDRRALELFDQGGP